MDISRLTLKRRTEDLREELAQVKREINESGYKDAADLQIFVHLKMQEIELLAATVDNLNIAEDPLIQSKFHEPFRQLRNDVRQAVLKWKCIFSKHHRRKRGSRLKEAQTVQSVNP
ncbi:MAG: hypothetical protein JW893_02300 [Candidatus Omnitrophica bacterium]|nr:hypothetical protein [Candidatus Omnitrophota bacterium]